MQQLYKIINDSSAIEGLTGTMLRVTKQHDIHTVRVIACY